MRARRCPTAALLLAVILALSTACGSDGGAGRSASARQAGRAKLKVVTSVAPITSIAANVAGDRAEITGVVPEGTNSHTFEPAPSVAEVDRKSVV